MKKVFITGFTQSPYITQLYSSLKQFDYEFYINNKESISDQDRQIYKKIYLTNELKWNDIFTIKGLWQLPIINILYFTIVKTAIDLNHPRTIYKYFKIHIYDYFLIKFIEDNLKADIIQVHSVTSGLAGLLLYADKKIKVVCSYWGTDLLNTSEVYNDFIISKVLKRADIISTESIQLREILVSKYGRNLLPKIKLNNFVLEKTFIDIIDKYSNNFKKYQILSELGFEHKNNIIIIGNNGNKTNNHIKIIEKLSSLNAEIKKDTLFVLPLTYALTSEYKAELVKVCEESGLNIKMLFEYLTIEDSAKLRLAADIMVMMPVADSYSAFFIESLYAGTKCIVGSWLPYETFKRMGLNFWEADFFENLPMKMEQVLNTKNFDLIKHRSIIREELFGPKVIEKWEEIL
jgi:hypothetical protein